MKHKAVILSILLCALLSIAIIAVWLLEWEDASLVYVALFPMSGVFGYIAAKLSGFDSWLGFVIPSAVLFIGAPFAAGLTHWWFGDGDLLIWFVVFFCLLIIGGWSLVCLPVMIADKHPGKNRHEVVINRIRLIVLFAIIAAILCWIFNLCFGNPITAYIAGEEMRDYLAEQADNGKNFEIMERHLPKYNWYDAGYTFDLTDGTGQFFIRWKKGDIRLGNKNW